MVIHDMLEKLWLVNTKQQKAWQCAYPVTTAGPRALAGLMHMELTGPSTHMSRQMARGTAKGPYLPHPLQANPA